MGIDCFVESHNLKRDNGISFPLWRGIKGEDRAYRNGRIGLIEIGSNFCNVFISSLLEIQ